MKFRKPYDQVPSVPSSSGETKKPVYTLVNRNGERSLKQVDEIDIPSYINSFESETDLHAMLRRYSLTGDISCLNRGGSYVYEDVSGCETNLAKLIESSREIALLKLQASQAGQKMSEKENGQDAALNGSDAAASVEIPNTEKTEVTNE